MKPGQKKIPDHLKVISGTAQPCRMDGPKKDAMKAIAENTETKPASLKRPTWMKGEPRKVWERILPILERNGKANDSHFDLILSYCLISGTQIDLAKKQELLKSSDRTELRRMGEALGLIIIDGGPTGGAKPKKNQFGNNRRGQ